MTALPKWNVDSEQLGDIIRTVKRVNFEQFPQVKSDLAELANKTSVQTIGVDPAGVLVGKDGFEGLAAVYVVLKYDQLDDPFTTSDAFRGKFRGHFSNGKPVIDEFTVDTSPFFVGSSD